MNSSLLFINCPDWQPKGEFRYYLNGLEVTYYIDNGLPLEGLRFFVLESRPVSAIYSLTYEGNYSMPDLSEYLKDCAKENDQQLALLFALIDCTCVDNLEGRKQEIKAELSQLRRNLAVQSQFLTKNFDIT